MEGINIRMNLLGHNEKGLIGFIQGGRYLSYLEKPNNADEIIEKFGLPYISHENVRAINLEVDEEKKHGKTNK
jgi:hypothetical protein